MISLIESNLLRTILLALGLLLGAWCLRHFLVVGATKWLKKSGYLPDGISVRKHFYPPLAIALAGTVGYTTLSFFELKRKVEEPLEHAMEVLLIVGVTWFLIRCVSFFELTVRKLIDTSRTDNLRERRIRTQMQFVVKVAMVTLLVIGLSMVLLTFPAARKFGGSILASAGIASVVIGFAAQKSIANFIAGFQIAFTQPIRIDDVVIVEKEWGRIEEIALTYVVVKIWDDRRLILPITYFIEKPFENWTRRSSQILGTVFLYTDFSVPLEEVRRELGEIVKRSPNWDERVCGLQVTDTTETTMQLRILVSASNASKCFDLRCELREALLKYLQTNHPGALPRVRNELSR